MGRKGCTGLNRGILCVAVGTFIQSLSSPSPSSDKRDIGGEDNGEISSAVTRRGINVGDKVG